MGIRYYTPIFQKLRKIYSARHASYLERGRKMAEQCRIEALILDAAKSGKSNLQFEAKEVPSELRDWMRSEGLRVDYQNDVATITWEHGL